MYSAVQYRTVNGIYCRVKCSAVHFGAPQYNPLQFSTVQCTVLQSFAVLFCAMQCTVLTAPQCTLLPALYISLLLPNHKLPNCLTNWELRLVFFLWKHIFIFKVANVKLYKVFTLNRPLRRLSQRVSMSVRPCVCLSVPSQWNLFWGRFCPHFQEL